MTKISNPGVKAEIVKRLACGESQANVAKDFEVSKMTISSFSRKENIRKLIEEEQLRLAEAAPDAVQNVTDLVREMPTIPKNEIKQRELAYKASRDVLKATGIFPSPSINIMSIHNDNRSQTVIAPDILDIIRRVTENSLEMDRVEECE